MLFGILISALSAGVLAAGSSSGSPVTSASVSGSHASGSSAASQTTPTAREYSFVSRFTLGSSGAADATVFTVPGLSPITVSSPGDVQPVLSAIEANSAKVASAMGTSSLFSLESSLLLEQGKEAVGTQTSLTAYITTTAGGAPHLVVGNKNAAQGLGVRKGLVAGAATAICALAVGAAMVF